MSPVLLVFMYVVPWSFLVLERFCGTPGRPWLTPGLVMDALFGPLRGIIYVLCFAALATRFQHVHDTHLSFLKLRLLDHCPVWIQMVGFYLVGDLFFYLWHRLMHQFPMFWYIHAVHHSGRVLNPFLHHRGHPFENILDSFPRMIFLGLFGGMNPEFILFVVIDFEWSYFVHSDIRTNLGPLKYILVTPQYHRIHHSVERRHYDKNLGGRLIIWDWLFGTLYPHFDEYPEIGVEDYPVREVSYAPWRLAGYHLRHIAYPFRRLWEHFTRPAEVTS